MGRGLTQDLHVLKIHPHLWGTYLRVEAYLKDGGGGGGGKLNRAITVFLLQPNVVNFYLVMQNCL